MMKTVNDEERVAAELANTLPDLTPQPEMSAEAKAAQEAYIRQVRQMNSMPSIDSTITLTCETHGRGYHASFNHATGRYDCYHCVMAAYMDAVHVEALRQNVIYSTDETYGSERYMVAWRAYAMTGEIDCPPKLVERDHAEALFMAAIIEYESSGA
jgi:hypothetical protein